MLKGLETIPKAADTDLLMTVKTTIPLTDLRDRQGIYADFYSIPLSPCVPFQQLVIIAPRISLQGRNC